MRANIQAANQARGGGNRLVPAEHSTWGGNAEDWHADVRTGRRRAEVAAATLAEVNVSSLAIEATSGFTVWIQIHIDAPSNCFRVLHLLNSLPCFLHLVVTAMATLHARMHFSHVSFAGQLCD